MSLRQRLSIILCMSAITHGAYADFLMINVPESTKQVGPSVSLGTAEIVNENKDQVAGTTYVQIMAVKSIDTPDLKEVFSNLAQRGYLICTSNSGNWIKVLIGPYASLNAANASLKNLREMYHDAFIVESSSCVSSKHDLNTPTIAQDKNMLSHTLPERQTDSVTEIKKPTSFSLVLYKGESIRHTLDRFANTYGYDRVVMGISASTDQVTASLSHVVRETALANVNLPSMFNNVPESGLYLHESLDGDQRSLVLTDQTYRPDQALTVFNVMPGSLLANIERLSQIYGWKVANNGWQLPVDYQIKFAYPLLVHDLFGGLNKLLKRYPVQAQLMQHTKEVAFASRPLPTTNTTGY